MAWACCVIRHHRFFDFGSYYVFAATSRQSGNKESAVMLTQCVLFWCHWQACCVGKHVTFFVASQQSGPAVTARSAFWPHINRQRCVRWS